MGNAFRNRIPYAVALDEEKQASGSWPKHTTTHRGQAYAQGEQRCFCPSLRSSEALSPRWRYWELFKMYIFSSGASPSQFRACVASLFQRSKLLLITAGQEGSTLLFHLAASLFQNKVIHLGSVPPRRCDVRLWGKFLLYADLLYVGLICVSTLQS